MPSFTSLAALTLLATTALTAPTPDTGVSITQVAAGQILLNGPAQVARTFAKFGKKPPSNVLRAQKPNQSGSVTATPEANDIEYLCPVTVGGTEMNLNFDTGSSDLWVFSSLLPASQRANHSIYEAKAKNKVAGESWAISYGDGSGASGTVYADSVTIGGVTATSQSVEAATAISSSFIADTASDGLVGLAFPNINSCSPNPCTPFVQNVVKSFKRGEHVFTAALKYRAPGTYNFGYVDESAYKGSLTYVPVHKKQGFWQFNTQGYAVAGGATAPKGISAIADTGTTLTYLPNGILSKYYASVPGSKNSNTEGGWIFPCAQAAKLPTFALVVGGTTFTIPGEYLSYAPLSWDASMCFGSLQSSEGLGINILGDVFLKSVFAVFDVGKGRIGFAEQA